MPRPERSRKKPQLSCGPSVRQSITEMMTVTKSLLLEQADKCTSNSQRYAENSDSVCSSLE